MKGIAVELNTTDAPEPLAGKGAAAMARAGFGSYLELTKPRITTLILLTCAAGFVLGSGGAVNYLLLAHTLLGVALLSSGVSTLNQYMERDLDGLMRRTSSRPLPAGRLAPRRALLFGAALTLAAEIYLSLLVSPLAALIGLGVVVGYLLCYTPLKTRTSVSTIVGALPGAAPPLLGWAASAGRVGAEAWSLFAILFVWQFPHFLAIAWMYRDDYARAGIRMLPVVEPEARLTAQQIIIWTLLLVPVSLFPAALGAGRAVYFAGALALGVLFLASGIAAARTRTRQGARRVLLASVLYLPLLFALMVFDR